MLRAVDDAAGLPSADPVGPNSSVAPARGGLETGRSDTALVGLAVASYVLGVALAYLVLVTPQVRRLSWALIGAWIVFAVLAVVLARSRRAHALLVRWAVPLIALVIGWTCVGAVVTWSFPQSEGTGWLILALLVVADLILVVFSLVAVVRDRKVGVLGLLIIGLLWLPALIGPAETTVLRLRVELAAPSLVEEAQRVLDDPSKAKDMGPFIASDDDRAGRVVGWLIGPGFLGEGPGLVWDPEGVLRASGAAGTDDGYPWVIYGYACEPIVDAWLYCDLQ